MGVTSTQFVSQAKPSPNTIPGRSTSVLAHARSKSFMTDTERLPVGVHGVEQGCVPVHAAGIDLRASFDFGAEFDQLSLISA
jgi:hypothetical protein